MSILNNAINSIIIGLEDFYSTDERRILSCVRNLYAGMLLMFKHKLAELSPKNSNEILIKRDILPIKNSSGVIELQGTGKATIDFLGIKKRFQSLEIDVDWKKIEKIQDYRNNIEHYFDNRDDDDIRKMILDIYLIIHKFIFKYLNDEPQSLFDEMKGGFNKFIKELIDEKWGAEMFLAFKDGGEYPIGVCPNCGESYFIFELHQCLDCGFEVKDYACKMCGEDIIADEFESYPHCGYCCYKLNKHIDD